MFDKRFYYATGSIAFLIFFVVIFIAPPGNFPKGAVINIPLGSSLRGVSAKLESEHIIKSRVAFEVFVILDGGEKHIIPADYLFDQNEPVFSIAERITHGDRHLAPVAVTIPEGFDTSDIASAASEKLLNFNKSKFLLQAKAREGYLFPDTYFYFSTDGEAEVLRSMSANFEKKILPLKIQITASGKTENEIITLASIIEREAKGDADRGIISGILWRRLAIGMPLQVDAAPETYRAKGLPKAPVCNPGIEAILAALAPVKSQYLYYLHDKDGGIHYAATFAEHVQNKLKYLK